MALTEYQRAVCRLLADHRIASGESYVAGGAALSTITDSPRISHDLDLFHDTEQALQATWIADRALLESSGYEVSVLRELTGFVEARVRRQTASVVLQWVRESVYRFFPLVRHEDFGLTLHPFDLATNKVLALAGRLAVRDWFDLFGCHDRIQPLGYLVWAAPGKDPGLGPGFILAEASRSTHYTAAEIQELQFNGPHPDPGALSRQWKRMMKEAEEIVAALPPQEVGKCVLCADGSLFRGEIAALSEALAQGQVRFHEGCIRGALPRIA